MPRNGLASASVSLIGDRGRERTIARSTSVLDDGRPTDTALLDLACQLAGALDGEAILRTTHERLAAALGCAAVATLRWEPRRESFRLLGVHGSGFDELLRSFEIGHDSPIARAFLGARTTVVHDFLRQEGLPLELLQSAGVRGLLWSELAFDNRIYGASLVLHTRVDAGFTAEHVAFVEGAGDLLGRCLEAAERHRARGDELAVAEALARELDAANRTKSDFVAAIAHDLRSPLSVIVGYSSLLLDGAFGELSGEQADVIQRVDRTTAMLSELVSTLLDFSRLESGQLRVDIGDVDVVALFAAVAEETRELRARKPEVEFRVAAADGLPRLQSDGPKLKIVLKNLIGNALKFTARGDITLTAAAAGDDVEICVDDTGMGISRDALDVIFEPFRQAPGTRQVHGGFGLGLYIVQRLLDLIGGSIRCESETGKGTRFLVRLPAVGVR